MRVEAFVRQTLAHGVSGLRESERDVHERLPDSVHQLRVRCRRLRTELRSLQALYADDRLPSLRSELAWLAGSFDAARDLEVLLARTSQAAQSAGWEPLDVSFVLDTLQGTLVIAEQQALTHLADPRVPTLFDALGELAAHPRLAVRGDRRARPLLAPLVEQTWHRFDLAARRLAADSDVAQWHRARILAKRARYTAEVAGPVLGATARRIANACERAQGLLGEHQDSVIAAARISELGQGLAGRWAFVCGRLVEREQSLGRQVRAEFVADWPKLRRTVTKA